MFEVVGDVEAYREVRTGRGGGLHDARNADSTLPTTNAYPQAYFARIPGLRSTQPELKYRPAQPAEDASGVTLTPREARPSVQTAAAVGCFGYARVQPIPLDGKDPPKQV